MGMFIWIDYECPCPKCGRLVKDFQSKNLIYGFTKVKPWQVNRFYSSCPHCAHWIEFERVDDAPDVEPPPEPEGWRFKYKTFHRDIEPGGFGMIIPLGEPQK